MQNALHQLLAPSGPEGLRVVVVGQGYAFEGRVGRKEEKLADALDDFGGVLDEGLGVDDEDLVPFEYLWDGWERERVQDGVNGEVERREVWRGFKYRDDEIARGRRVDERAV